MDLSYSAEYEKFRAEVRAFLDEQWTDADRNSTPPPDGQATLMGSAIRTDERATQLRLAAIARGYLYRHVPKAYGGGEQPYDPLKSTIIAEEFRRAKAPGEVVGQGPGMLVPTLVEHGSEEQKAFFIRDTLLGKIRWCQGYSEPGSGSDLASLRTRAELEGDFWVVNGQKIWTSNAMDAEWMFALVRTEPDAPKHDGISYLLIDMKTPGLDVRPLRQMTGEADFNEVFLDNVRVPKKNLVGPRGKGWIVSRSTLKHERALIGNAMLTRRTFDGLVMMAQAVQLRGQPAIKHPVIRDRLAQLEARLLASEYTGYRLLTMQARGEDQGLTAMVMKLFSTQLGYDLSKTALDVLGDRSALGRGDMNTPDMGMFTYSYMWSLGDDVALHVGRSAGDQHAERGLGLPRDKTRG